MELASLIVAVALAFAGWIVTYVNNLRLARRRERLDLVTERLNRLYGPLYVTTQTAQRAYATFVASLGRAEILSPEHPPTPDELRLWRVWLDTVVAPLDSTRAQIIIDNAHLIREREMPEEVLEWLAWVYGYRTAVASGEPLERFFTAVPYPGALVDYANRSYAELKQRQLELIGAD